MMIFDEIRRHLVIYPFHRAQTTPYKGPLRKIMIYNFYSAFSKRDITLLDQCAANNKFHVFIDACSKKLSAPSNNIIWTSFLKVSMFSSALTFGWRAFYSLGPAWLNLLPYFVLNPLVWSIGLPVLFLNFTFKFF